MGNIFWTGYSNGERHEIILQVKQTVAAYGDLVDFKLFSDIAIGLTIEIKERTVSALYHRLKAHLLLDDYNDAPSASDKERVIYLNITFTRSTGDLRIEMPSVPG